MTTTARACSYNPITNTLSLSESFIKKASRMGTAEYKMVVQYQKDHPGLTINEMEKKTSEKKRDTVTYTRMEETIARALSLNWTAYDIPGTF